MSASGPPQGGQFPERRAASPVADVKCVAPGTLMNVPAVQPTGGSGEHPVVAVNTVHWYKDPQFLAAAVGGLIAISDPIIEALSKQGPINWRSLVLGCVLALVAWLRTRTNTVTK